MKTFFATFRHGHTHSNRLVEIIAEDHHAARYYMITTYGDQWDQQKLRQSPPNRRGLRLLETVHQTPNCADIIFTRWRTST